MNDIRIPLSESSCVIFDGCKYEIKAVIGYGGSCLAYSANRKPSGYESSIGMPPTPAVIKEFYPLELSEYISRSGNILCVNPSKKRDFSVLKGRFESGMVNQAMFFMKDSDHSFVPTRIVPDNGTVYAVVDSVQGDILTNVCGQLNIQDIGEIMRSLCYAIQTLHNDDKLHLDIKPSNIFLFNKDSCDSKRIALFDFDTVTAISEIKTAIIPVSESWSPYEQSCHNREQISFATDIYAIGAVFYWLMSNGEKVTDSVLNSIKRHKFDFINQFSVLKGKKSPLESVKKILEATLKRVPSEREQRVEGLLNK